MKRSEIRKTISDVGALTYKVEGQMQIVSKSTGETFDVDPDITFMIVRGAFIWFEKLLSPGAKPDSTAMKNLQSLMFDVGKSISFSLEPDEED